MRPWRDATEYASAFTAESILKVSFNEAVA